MSAVIERRILDRLIALGRATGRLSSEELAAHLPIAAMTAEDIALVVLELEEAGVEVAFEGSFEAAGRLAPVRPVAELPPLPAPAPASGPSAGTLRPSVPAASAPPRPGPSGGGATVTRAVLAAGALTILVVVVVLLLVRR